MQNITNFFENDSLVYRRWCRYLCKTKQKEFFLMVALAPLFANAFNSLKKITVTSSYIQDNDLREIVKSNLTKILFSVVSRTFVYEMYLAVKNQIISGETSAQRFDAFIEYLENPKNSYELLSKYPELINVLNSIYNQFISSFSELFQRFSKDMSLLKEKFLFKDNFFLVQVSRSGDSHCWGRSVCILTLKRGQQTKKIIYKPRSLTIDTAFSQFCNWVVRQGVLDLKMPQILDLKDYGWCEFIQYRSCRNAKEVINFYKRMGIYLAIFHLLGSVDFHAENMIAMGEYPIFIDMECLLRPQFKSKNCNDTKDPLPPHLVTETVLLPMHQMSNRDYAGLDVSAIGAKGGEAAPYKKMKWIDCGTDQMRLIRDTSEMPATQNVPQLKGTMINPEKYGHYVRESFLRTYKILFNKRKILLQKKIAIKRVQKYSGSSFTTCYDNLREIIV